MSRTERLEAKNKELERRIELLEKLQADGIDRMVVEIQRLSKNDAVIGGAVESHDTTIAVLRSLLVDKKVLSDEGIEARRKEIVAIRERVEQERSDQNELRQVQFRAAEAAKEDAGHPKEAFIFGG